MISWRNFRIDALRTVIFSPAAIAASRAVSVALSQFGDVYDGEMQALPLPDDVPPEVPRIILQRRDGLRRIEIGSDRIASLWTNQPDLPELRLEDVVRECTQVQDACVNALRMPIGRVAVIAVRACFAEDPAQKLVERFCNESSRREPFNRSAQFEIHNFKAYRPAGGEINYDINSWVRCRTAVSKHDQRSVVQVEQDLNTLAEDLELRRFDVNAMRTFFTVATRELDDILQKYFPGTESK